MKTISSNQPQSRRILDVVGVGAVVERIGYHGAFVDVIHNRLQRRVQIGFTSQTGLSRILHVQFVASFTGGDVPEVHSNVIGDLLRQDTLVVRDGGGESQDCSNVIDRRIVQLLEEGQDQTRVDATGKGYDVLMVRTAALLFHESLGVSQNLIDQAGCFLRGQDSCCTRGRCR